ncbi:uncharacterized protein [Pseudorasbora parva]|uniref:uncharacterized protein n=1 Tax=Pseudorasbora parva TaxID=51549 RepID=UPI00351EDD54
MGIFIVPRTPRAPASSSAAVNWLWGLQQDGRPLERYVEEFSELAHLVNWHDALLNAVFLMGLDEDTIRFMDAPCSYSLVDTINLVLFLNGSLYKIEGCVPRLNPSATSAAGPVHQQPGASTYPSSGPSAEVPTARKLRNPRRASSKPAPSAQTATTTPEPEEGWLIDFWAEPLTVLQEPAPGFQEPAHEPAPGPQESAPGPQVPPPGPIFSRLPRAATRFPRATTRLPRAASRPPRAPHSSRLRAYQEESLCIRDLRMANQRADTFLSNTGTATTFQHIVDQVWIHQASEVAAWINTLIDMSTLGKENHTPGTAACDYPICKPPNQAEIGKGANTHWLNPPRIKTHTTGDRAFWPLLPACGMPSLNI